MRFKRTISKNPDPLPFEPPPRPMTGVLFNLNKIRRLSGQEKMELLRDYTKHSQTVHAVFVFKIIKNNGYVNLLSHSDLHNLFRLLIRDAVENKSTILEIYSEFKARKTHTENFMNDLAQISCKWQDVELSLGYLEQMKSDKMSVKIHVFDHLLELLLNVGRLSEAMRLLKEMECTTGLRKSKRTFSLAIKLYGLSNNNRKILEELTDAEENLNRLEFENNKIHDCEAYKANLMTRYLQQALGLLIQNSMFKTAFTCYSEYLIGGYITKSNGSGVFKLMFKMLSIMDRDKHQLNDYTVTDNNDSDVPSAPKIDELGEILWTDLQRLELEADYLLYCRMISIQTTLENLNKWYVLAPKVPIIEDTRLKVLERRGWIPVKNVTSAVD